MTAAAVRGAAPRGLFVLAVLLGSFLLFLVQPMVARLALPRLGGAPAVWLSAMLVYQALLLAGYAWAHRMGRLSPDRARWLHLALLGVAALWLPVGLRGPLIGGDVSPVLSVPALLLLSIGPLFLAVSAGAPLIGRWYAAAHPGRDPYPLYAASNLGSFAGLLAYPVLLEPLLPLRTQTWLWSGLYALLIVLIAAAALRLPAAPPQAEEAAAEPLPLARVLRWILLSAVPSGLMLSTTAHLTTDLVALPLIWVVPLGLYLLSFTVAFAERRGLADTIGIITPLLLLVGGGFAFSGGARNAFFQASVGLLLLFAVCVALHAQLFRERPSPARLTAFYLAMAAGGVLGGLFTALVAPVLFDWTYEHPILLLAAAALVPQRALVADIGAFWSGPRGRRNIALAVAIIFILALAAADGFGLGERGRQIAQVALTVVAGLVTGQRLLYVLALLALMLSLGGSNVIRESAAGARERSFFGVYKVGISKGDRVLMHGTTLHGLQQISPGRERVPTTYYAPGSGVGLAIRQLGGNATVGVVGLGSGTLACYRQGAQRFTFFEIDPTVVEIAREKFSFIPDCAPASRIVLGDARLSLAAEGAGLYDLLAIDAFSSDAIPTHLVTREAFDTYARALRPDGLLMVHISNRYIDLQPVLAAVSRVNGWHAAVRDYEPDDAARDNGALRSVWVAMTRRPETLRSLVARSGADWAPLREGRAREAWTDDYASVLPHLKFVDLPWN